MRVNVSKLKGKSVEKGLTGEEIARRLGIDQSTYYRKLKDDGMNFTIDQAYKIADILSLTREEAVDIFFDS